MLARCIFIFVRVRFRWCTTASVYYHLLATCISPRHDDIILLSARRAPLPICLLTWHHLALPYFSSDHPHFQTWSVSNASRGHIPSTPADFITVKHRIRFTCGDDTQRCDGVFQGDMVRSKLPT